MEKNKLKFFLPPAVKYNRGATMKEVIMKISEHSLKHLNATLRMLFDQNQMLKSGGDALYYTIMYSLFRVLEDDVLDNSNSIDKDLDLLYAHINFKE